MNRNEMKYLIQFDLICNGMKQPGYIIHKQIELYLCEYGLTHPEQSVQRVCTHFWTLLSLPHRGSDLVYRVLMGINGIIMGGKHILMLWI